MQTKFRIRLGSSLPDNLKSKTCTELCRSIENPKWVGIFAIVVTFVFGGVEGAAQQPKKVHRIGYLSSTDPATESARAEAIRLALRERGYIEGESITAEYRYAEGKIDRYPRFSDESVDLSWEVI